MKLIRTSLYLVFSLILLSGLCLKAEGVEGKNKDKVYKTTGTPATTKFNINNVSTFFGNDGISDLSTTGDSGFQFPIGSGKTVFYESGFVYGGDFPKADGTKEFRISGSTYNRGQVPGRILPDGSREASTLPHVRIYRVRPDYKDPQADYSKEIMDEGLTKDQIYAQYDKDWKEWPAQYGAPYKDVDGIAGYDPNKDIPGVPGADQTIWFVNNDTDPTQAQKLYGSEGLTMEMQATIFGYNQQNALGDGLFRKYLLINKSGKEITDFYVCMWSDPDLGGDAGDDFAGVDTLLSLGYIYNGDDSDPSYGQYIPASGFDFMQGPIVKGAANDVAIFKNKTKTGYKNLPASTFFLFTQSVANWGDPTLGNYTNGALRFRNLFQGKNATLGTPFIDPLTGKTSKFFAPGDPVTGKGWIDGILFPKQDRRIGLVAGPFTMAVGDTQEVVVGQLAAGGVAPVTRLGAVALLKYQDLQVQQAYNNFFQVPTPPKAPIVELDPVTKIGKASEFDQKLIINWGIDAASVTQTEGHNQLGYKFQGYVVYQLPRLNAQLSEGKIVATYDLADLVSNIESLVFDPVTNATTRKFTKFGENQGIKRSIEITKDAVRGGIPLANGTEYYFVVSAYSYNPDPNAVPNVLETLSAKILAVPHAPNPGTAYTVETGTALTYTHPQGGSDGKVIATVVDPSKVTGNSYEISFAGTIGNTTWTLVNKTTGKTVLTGVKESLGAVAPLVDGLQVDMTGAPNDFKNFIVTANAGGKLATPAMGCFAFNSNGFPLWQGLDRPAAGQMKNSTALWGIHTGMNSATMDPSYAFFLTRVPRGGANWPRVIPYDFEIRFTAAGSKALMAFSSGNIVQVPFELWNIGIGTPDNTADDFKLAPLVYDEDANDMWNLLKSDHTVSGGTDDPYTDWIYLYDVADKTPGTKGYDAVVASNFDEQPTSHTLGLEILARVVVVSWNGGDVNAANFPANQKAPQPEVGSVFRILTTKPNQPTSGTTGDKFAFTAPSVVTGNVDLAKEEVEKINVFPNPYYGVNPREVNKYQRYVTFSHLPEKATLRIFNLAGQLVRVIEKNSTSQFATWDLLNESSFPVASGLFIVYVDMPDLGKTKVLKLSVIQEQQILDHY
jgi:hypothetical protein